MPQQPPAMVPFIASLPIWLRLLISLSAGVVEETFFRGFLQPRVGIPLSTAFFALAHLSYGQPFMLIGITLLSLDHADRAARPCNPDVLLLDEALSRLGTIDARMEQVVELHYFAGLTYDELAEALSISTATVHRDLAFAKAWLRRQLSAD